MGFTDYFLIVFDYVRFAVKNGIYVGVGRGSAAGSLVAYSLGITWIDPLKYNLLFERFMAHGRTPDLDVDFSDQEHVFKHLQGLHGMDNVARIRAYGTLSCKNVVRKILSAFDFSQKDIAVISGSIPKRLDVTVEQAYNESTMFKKFMDDIRLLDDDGNPIDMKEVAKENTLEESRISESIKEGKSIILITHKLKEIKEAANRCTKKAQLSVGLYS